MRVRARLRAQATAQETAVADSDEIAVTLDRSVALVLFDFLARATDEEDGEFLADALLHKAELPALWATLAALESVLTEPFAAELQRRSRRRVPRSSRSSARRRGSGSKAAVLRHSGADAPFNAPDIEIKYKPGRSATDPRPARSSRCRWQPTILLIPPREQRGLRPLPQLIFSSRWLQLPLYIGLIVAQGVYVLLFVKELWHLVQGAMRFHRAGDHAARCSA